MNNVQKNKRTEIITHLLVWATMLILPYGFTVALGRSWDELIVRFWLQLFLIGIIFYINYFFAVKRLLFRKNRILFFVFNIILIAFFVWIQHVIFQHYFQPNSHSNNDQKDKPPLVAIFYVNALFYLIPVAFAIAVQTGKRLLSVEIQRQETDNINLQTQLQLLKYQLQPHFFFNSLNNIYALVDAAPDKAKQTLHSLSKLMRHLLKSSEAEKVSLADEVEFLNQYIALMTIRQNANTKIETNFPKHIPTISIAPLLFVSIVENAFKHGVSATKPSWLYFELSINNEQEITFTSKNYIFPKNQNDVSGSGIGIENLKKRLALLYNNKHTFQINSTENLFIVTLTLKVV
ncbi:MAG: histidine kinase [Chitinophagales bacterium]